MSQPQNGLSLASAEPAALVEPGSVGPMHLIPAERCVGPLPSLEMLFAFRGTTSLHDAALHLAGKQIVAKMVANGLSASQTPEGTTSTA
jgi:hypothetical protein